MTALITGAGRGLGRQYAERLAKKGYNLVLVGRSSSVLDAAREIQEKGYGVSVRPVVLDLATENAAETLFDDIKVHSESIDVLINNAGQFSFRDITEVDEDTIRRMIFLHDLTLTKLCRLFGQKMIETGGGHILNMSSYSIWMPLPGIALYSASKAYVKAFSIAFSKEVREKGVYVTAICPAGIATDLYGLSKNMQSLGVRCGVLLTPDRCAKLSLRALFRHRRWAVPDWWNCAFIPILKHLPNWAENIIRRKTMKFQK